MCSKILHFFCWSKVESVISWAISIRARGLKILKGWFSSGDYCGTNGEEFFIKWKKLWATLSIFFLTCMQQQSIFIQRLFQTCCNTDCYRRPFLPTAISIFSLSEEPSITQVFLLLLFFNNTSCI
uniref:Uncharacterized protein n=1 Tax=Nothobranchius kuhntae TaxID=321403 RepID=A0A1A8IUU2_NOTKU